MDGFAIKIIEDVCRDFDDNGIYRVGACAALRAMAPYWESRLAEGHNPTILSEDIGDMKNQLEALRTEIMRPLLVTESAPRTVCAKCGTRLTGNGYCAGDTCPHSDWPQHIPLAEIYSLKAEELRAKYDVLPRIRVRAEVYDETGLKKVEFDAAAWFAQASDDDIIKLRNMGWANDWTSDRIAEYFADSNEDIADLLNFCRTNHRTYEPQGFESSQGFGCSIDEDSAMAWLKQHRPVLWTWLLRAQNDAQLF